MGPSFLPTYRRQHFIFHSNPALCADPDHDVFFVIDCLERYDITPIVRKYRQDGVGGQPFDPRQMVLLLGYAYWRGIRSSRKIEKAFEDSIGFRAICPRRTPDHVTISRFRKDNRMELGGLFEHILKEAQAQGMIDPGTASLDGTKVKANAALSANATDEILDRQLAKIAEEEAAEKADNADPALSGLARAAKKRGRRSRIERRTKAKAKLEKKKAARLAGEAQKQEERLRKQEETGKKARGRKPKKLSAEELSEGKVNTTDPESEIMKTKHGYLQGYNAQIVVTMQQIILAADVTTQQNDMHQLTPMIERTQESLGALGIDTSTFTTLLADTGYCSAANLAALDGEAVVVLTPPKKDKKVDETIKTFKGRESESPLASEPLTTIPGMAHYLSTPEGRERYKKRGSTVEPTFGQIKENEGIRSFMCRGLEACRSEWRMICAMHNLRKIKAHRDRLKKAA